MAIYPNEMVPLQIDLAIGVGQYLRASSSNPAGAASWRSRRMLVRVAEIVIGHVGSVGGILVV